MRQGVPVIAVVALLFAGGIALGQSGETVSGEVKSCAEFHGVHGGSAKGHAELTNFPDDSEFTFVRMKGLKPGAIHVFWLRPRHRTGHWVGAGVKADREGVFRGASEVLGSTAVARRHINRTRSILVTSNSRKGLHKIGKLYLPGGWQEAGRVIGDVEARGTLSPPQRGACDFS